MQTVTAANLKFLIHNCPTGEIGAYMNSGIAMMSGNSSLVGYGLSHWLKEGNKRNFNTQGTYYIPPTGGYMPKWPI